MVVTLFSLPLFLLASASPVGIKDERVTPSMSCQVIQAAYTAATLAPATNLPHLLVYPTNVVSDRFGLSPMKSWLKDYVARLNINPADFNGLVNAQSDNTNLNYKPSCEWRGDEYNHTESGVVYTTSFSEPVISKKHDLAAIEVSFYSPGRFAYGKTCIARRTKGWWTARCYPGWIT